MALFQLGLWLDLCGVCLSVSGALQFWNCMEVTYLPIYEPTAEEQQNPKLFARNVQK